MKTIGFKGGFEIFNLGYGSPIKLLEFISILEQLTGITANKEYSNRQPGDVDVTYADISKAKEYLDFQPKIGVTEGLKKYLNWFKQYYTLLI